MKKCKRFTAILLSLALLLGGFAFAVPASAAKSAVKTTCGGKCGHTPLIVLPGINNPQFYIKDPNEPDGVKKTKDGAKVMGSMFLLNQDGAIDTALKEAIWPLLKTVVTQKDDGSVGTALGKVLQSLFEYQRTDKNGNLVHKDDLQVIRYNESFASVRANKRDYNLNGENDVEYLYQCLPFQSLTKVIGEDHAYFFMFDICGNPMQNADDLNAYIQMVKKETGHSKVSIAAVSLGGTILTAYVDKYKNAGDIDKIVNAVPLLDGTSLASDLYSKNLKLFDDEFLFTQLLQTLLGNDDQSRLISNLLNMVLRILPHDVLVDGILDPAMDAALETMFLHNPQWWAMMRTKDYAALANKLIPKKDYPVLRAKTDAFFKARQNFASNIRFMVDKKGVEVNNVGGYNVRFSDFEPLFTILGCNDTVNGDGMIDADSTTFGATVAPPGKTFPKGYTQKVASSKINSKYPKYSYVSPDRNIDLSTALLPENTWMFYNLEHEDAGRNAPTINLCVWLFLQENANVHTDPVNHPQFGLNAPSKDIWRSYIPDIDKALQDYYKGGNTRGLTKTQVTNLEKAKAAGQKVISASLADKVKVDAVLALMNAAMIDAGLREAPQPPEDTFWTRLKADFLKSAADQAEILNGNIYKILGGMGYFESFLFLLKKYLSF